MDALEGPGAWKRLPATPKQLLRDNATTLIGQMRDQRPPFSKADAEAIKTPTLFIGGANTKGTLPMVLRALAAQCEGLAHRDDPGHHASDVRAGAAEILRDRAGVSGGGLIAMQTLRTSTVTTWPISRSARSPPLVCVHGTLGDFRTWNAVRRAAVEKHRVISLSLRRFFPEHWDGVGNDYLMAQHVADVIGFIEKIEAGPVDLMGHSRGGHIGFRVAAARPDLLRRLVLAEPGGDLDASLHRRPPRLRPMPLGPRDSGRAAEWSEAATSTARCRCSSMRSTAMAPGRDAAAAPSSNCATISLRCSARSVRIASRSRRRSRIDQDADPVDRRRRHHGSSLAVHRRVLAEHFASSQTAVIPGTSHWMFDQAPQEFCDAVLEFLAACSDHAHF